MKENLTIRSCPECESPLPSDAPEGLCPECLMLGALKPGDSNPEETIMMTADEKNAEHPLPNPGDQFGDYRIEKELGRGGMGAVYEAVQQATGRHVALKVLSHQLDSPEARARFLREGRLAASINHPNSVYVFGTEEIEGTPAISMELIAGGTLEERVNRDGPLPVDEAVDVVLQLIAGLERAQKVGILHRDVKPANCFEDTDGTVKIGDFGLSISTEGQGNTNLTLEGAFLGTPAFSSPEQLRGEELNARSDIYSVGATLYYLLTAQIPISGKSVAQIFANVLEKPAPSPRSLRPELPADLAHIVLRCLAKPTEERFSSYAELREALTPFSSEAPIPARLSLRFFAGLVGAIIWSAILAVPLFSLSNGPVLSLNRIVDSTRAVPFALALVIGIIFFALCEGLHGITPGKWLCRLRTERPDHSPPGFIRALVRTVITLPILTLPLWLAVAFGLSIHDVVHSLNIYTKPNLWIALAAFSPVVCLFALARRHNGWAAIHDFVTGTRVVQKPVLRHRPARLSHEASQPVSNTDAHTMVGPYHILESIEKTSEHEWFLGYDSRLLRKVWIQTLPEGAPEYPLELRELKRIGRLRWIAGNRATNENWDVFEAPGGEPLLQLIDQPQTWALVRYWLLDLAEEFNAAERDATAPASLSLEHLWITKDGRAKYFDFPAPGLEIKAGDKPVYDSISHFLKAIADLALSGQETLPPRHACNFLGQLPRISSTSEIVSSLQELLHSPVAVSRRRQASLLVLPVLLVVALLILVGGVMFSSLDSHEAKYEIWRAENPTMANFEDLMEKYTDDWADWVTKDPQDRIDPRHFEVYIAGEFRELAENPETWRTPYLHHFRKYRNFVTEAIKRHPKPSTEELSEAKQLIKLSEPEPEYTFHDHIQVITELIMIMSILVVVLVGIPGIITALTFRGGLFLRFTGLEIARKDGAQAGRFRIFCRSLLTWAPIASIVLMYYYLDNTWLAYCLAAIAIGLPIASLLLFPRGIQDRLAGTTMVAR